MISQVQILEQSAVVGCCCFLVLNQDLAILVLSFASTLFQSGPWAIFKHALCQRPIYAEAFHSFFATTLMYRSRCTEALSTMTTISPLKKAYQIKLTRHQNLPPPLYSQCQGFIGQVARAKQQRKQEQEQPQQNVQKKWLVPLVKGFMFFDDFTSW